MFVGYLRKEYHIADNLSRGSADSDCSIGGKTGKMRKEREIPGGRALRLRIVLPKVTPEAITVPTRCAYAGCGGSKWYLRQAVAKPLRDTVYHEVQVHR